MTSTIKQHNVEIYRNRAVWERKPLLREVYGDFYREIGAALSRGVPGRRVELGSGMGNIKGFVPDCLTTDIFSNPWLDACEDAYALSFEGECLSDLILFDVWHHLEFPGTALAEFRRVLAPGGRLILFEPAMGWLGRSVYGLCHHEPLGLREPIRWHAPDGFNPAAAPYFAAQSRASRIFLHGEGIGHLDGWRAVSVRPLSALAYLASGGFSRPQLYPTVLLPVLRRMEGWLSRWPALFATRLLVVLEKTA